jgi:putative endonuclease
MSELTTRAQGQAAATGRAGKGQRAEDAALAHLQRHGLKLLVRNYRVARGPSARGGEVDLILRDRDSTVVFVEVRTRSARGHGGAAASVSMAKQRRIVLAAQHYLLRWPSPPPCRFDVVAIDGAQLEWLQAAFDAA